MYNIKRNLHNIRKITEDCGFVVGGVFVILTQRLFRTTLF